MTGHRYNVLARITLPPFETERRYVLMETEMAQRELEKLPKRSWLPFSYPGLGILRREDWRKYIKSLEKYSHELDHHEQEIQGGLLPLSFSVVHQGGSADSSIQVHIVIGAGTIHRSKKPPVRPKRIDGAINKQTGSKFYGFERFTRSGISIGSHGIEAKFSRLEAHDNALVVNQVMYISISKQTRLSYEVRSRGLPQGRSGEVGFGR